MLPRLLVANSDGEIIDCPEYAMAAIAGNKPIFPENLIPLPEGSTLYTLPGRFPIGFDEKTGKEIVLKNYLDEPVLPVAAFVAPAYTQLMRPAFEKTSKAPLLPLFCYTAVGWKDDKFWVPAVRIDECKRQDANQFSERKIKRGARELLKRYPKNRLVKHLMKNCCLKYRCPAARNFALGRWEMPLPTSRACNSKCLGCISFQSTKKLCSPQERITFTPTPEEIAEIVIPHFKTAEQPVASFGQGCEGEPLTEWETIGESIKIIRSETQKGTINLNTNASYPERIGQLLEAGLDSIRVSMNSARSEYYERYFRPSDYKFEDILESIKITREKNKFVSLNYFVFPGFTDQKDEWVAFEKLLKSPGVNMIQWRNLNIDPDWYIEEMGIDFSIKRIGLKKVMDNVREKFPEIRFGYFNPYIVPLSD